MSLSLALFAAFFVLWVILAIRPLDRQTWWLENIAVFAAVPGIVLGIRAGLLSDRSLIIILAFAVLHIAAAHYSYAKTPWGDWLKRRLRLHRNQYDRIVHFLYGFLLVPVAADLLSYPLPLTSFRNGFIVFVVIVAFGALYEVAEYIAAVMLGKTKGIGFLGFQGDLWDTQKDMLVQTLGALLGVLFWH